MTPERIAWAALSVLTLIVSVAIHEFAHAFAAHKLGDDLPEREGRLTLNPIAHMDPIGTLLLPVVGAMLGGYTFGWGRPVHTLPIRYTRKISMRGGEALVAFAGPFSNLLIALVCTALFSLLPYSVGVSVFHFLQIMATLNFVLFILNMLPFPPLDGSKIAAWIFGHKADGVLDSMASMGFMGLFVVILLAGSGISWTARAAFNSLTAILGG